MNSADSVLGIVDQQTYNQVPDVWDTRLRGPLSEGSQAEMTRLLLSLLDADYAAFPADSMEWFSRVVGALRSTSAGRSRLSIGTWPTRACTVAASG